MARRSFIRHVIQYSSQAEGTLMAAEERDDVVESSEASEGQVNPVPGVEHEVEGTHAPKHAGGPAPESESVATPAHAAPLDFAAAPEVEDIAAPAHAAHAAHVAPESVAEAEPIEAPESAKHRPAHAAVPETESDTNAESNTNAESDTDVELEDAAVPVPAHAAPEFDATPTPAHAAPGPAVEVTLTHTPAHAAPKDTIEADRVEAAEEPTAEMASGTASDTVPSLDLDATADSAAGADAPHGNAVLLPIPTEELRNQGGDMSTDVFGRFVGGVVQQPLSGAVDAGDVDERGNGRHGRRVMRSKVVPGEGKSRSKARTLIVFLFMAAAMIAVGAFVAYGAELWGGKVVPDVVNKSQSLATTTLTEKGFSVSVVEERVDDGVGKVISVDPAIGSRLAVGSQVTLHVGVARTIPDVTGMPLDDAKAALEDVGAQNFTLTYQASSEVAGTVIAVEPAAGSNFSSNDTITLTIAQSHTIPYVLGKKEKSALSVIEAAGLKANVTYVKSDKDLGVVVSCSPEPGSKVKAGSTVDLEISASSPADYHHLVDYFSYNPKIISNFLSQQKFILEGNYIDPNNALEALYNSERKGTITFSPQPFSRSYDASKGSTDSELLSEGTKFSGIRLDIPTSELPSGASSLSDSAVQAIMNLCGFTGKKQVVDQRSAKLPQSAHTAQPAQPTQSAPTTQQPTQTSHPTQSGSAPFICAYGEMDDYYWTVLIASEGGATRATVTAAPKSLYSSLDLSQYDGSLCSFVAFSDIYAK